MSAIAAATHSQPKASPIRVYSVATRGPTFIVWNNVVPGSFALRSTAT